MPSKKKKYNARFPPARIKKIMQADEEVGKVAAVVPVIISRTLEIFVESLLTKASQVTRARNARTLTPAHLKASINSESQFSFLREMVSAVPDIQTSLDDESLVPFEATSSSSSVQTAHSNAKPVTRSRQAVRTSTSRSGRGRSRKLVRQTERSASTCDDDDDADELDDGDEDDEGDEDSSCDNSIPGATDRSDSYVATVPQLAPLVSTAAHVIDDDYDAV